MYGVISPPILTIFMYITLSTLKLNRTFSTYVLSTLKINLTLNMQNIQHIFDIEVKYDIEHPCVFDIEVKPDIEHAANLAPITTSTFKIC